MELSALAHNQEEDGTEVVNWLVEALNPFFALDWAEKYRFDGVFAQQSLSLGCVKSMFPGIKSIASADGLYVSREICPF
jgi:hypothetical protein